MTAGPATLRLGAHGHTAARHPVRVDTDGDFALDDLLSLRGVGPARRISAAEATQAALWRLDAANGTGLVVTPQPDDIAEHNAPTEDDAVLLHRIETGGLFRPPVREHLAALTPAVGAAWLARTISADDETTVDGPADELRLCALNVNSPNPSRAQRIVIWLLTT
jgi:hypothetical protein